MNMSGVKMWWYWNKLLIYIALIIILACLGHDPDQGLTRSQGVLRNLL